MKQRPRRVERKIAEIISAFSSLYGYSEVRRIPVLGREGPDIETNELGLVIDVKSRLEVPKLFVLSPGEFIAYPKSLIAVRLDEMELLSTSKPNLKRMGSVTVQRWFDHMHAWKIENQPDGITALVLHRPGQEWAASALVINSNERNKLCQKIQP
jgi:hypothetical protein